MRALICAFIIVSGCAGGAYAQDSRNNINPRWKQIEIPSINPNTGFTTTLGADQSNIWSTPDPSSIGQSRKSWNDDDRAFGLTISRPIQY